MVCAGASGRGLLGNLCRMAEIRQAMAAPVRGLGRAPQTRLCPARHDAADLQAAVAKQQARGGTAVVAEEDIAGTLSPQARLLHDSLAGIVRTKPVSRFQRKSTNALRAKP